MIEFRYADGYVVSGRYEDYAQRRFLNQGDSLEYDNQKWVLFDRVDRAGVTVYLCRPAESGDEREPPPIVSARGWR